MTCETSRPSAELVDAPKPFGLQMDSSMYSTWLRMSQGQAGWRSKAMHYEYVSIALQCAFPCIVSIFCEQRRGPTHGSAAMSREPWASTAIARPSKKSLGEVGHFDSQLQVLWDHMHNKTLQKSRLLPRHWPRALFRQLRYNARATAFSRASRRQPEMV